MADFTKFIEKIKSFQKAYEKEEDKLPYHFNVIDQLHANENAHSRILQQLLLYERNKSYPFLNSFINKFIPEEIILTTPDVTHNKELIDLFIIDSNKNFACIIENKIHGAIDQEKQIERYITTAKNKNCDNIYVIYLTRDGSKQVSDISFTKEAKNALNYQDNNNSGNFIPINYKNDILPWLKDDIINNCLYKEQKMIAGIIQYIDHLEGMFNMRKDKKEMNEEIIINLKNSWKIKDDVNGLTRVQGIEETINNFSYYLNLIKQSIIDENLWEENFPKKLKDQELANKIKNEFTTNWKNYKYTCTKPYIWDKDGGEAVVFDGWKINKITFSIDIHMEDLKDKGIEFWVRSNDQGEEPPAKDSNALCDKYFLNFLTDHSFDNKENTTHYKITHEEITSEDGLNDFINYLKDLLKDLSNSRKDWKSNKQ